MPPVTETPVTITAAQKSRMLGIHRRLLAEVENLIAEGHSLHEILPAIVGFTAAAVEHNYPRDDAATMLRMYGRGFVEKADRLRPVS